MHHGGAVARLDVLMQDHKSEFMYLMMHACCPDDMQDSFTKAVQGPPAQCLFQLWTAIRSNEDH